MSLRIHLLGLPNANLTKDYALCGFAQAGIRFAQVLEKLGATVYLYAGEENEAPCTELITVMTNEERERLLGTVPYQYAAMESVVALWQLSNARIIHEIAKRKEPHDLICTIGGRSQEAVAEAHPDLITVEYSIGYVGSFAKYRVYESHTWRHCTHGFQNDVDGHWFDDVIPLHFDPATFPFRADKAPYALYVGRLMPKKGITVACEAAALAGVPLKVIGHGDPGLVTHGAEYLGAVSTVARNHWMASASALICPTLYLEPFGAIAVEAMLCGTPVVAPDFGAFVETVEQGKTGLRCTYLGEFAEALHAVRAFDPAYIRDRAVRLYSLDTAAVAYRRYFDCLALLWDRGWETGPRPVSTSARELELV